MTEKKDIYQALAPYNKEILCMYGEPATGKTTFAQILALIYAKEGKKVLYLDTEGGFSAERFQQLAGENYEQYLEHIFLSHLQDFKHQCDKISELARIFTQFDLIILDTIGAYYRKEIKEDSYGVNRLMERQLRILNEIAREVPVIITNQVYTNIETNNTNPVGGNLIKKWSRRLIELKKEPRTIVEHKDIKQEHGFVIEEQGIFIV